MASPPKVREEVPVCCGVSVERSWCLHVAPLNRYTSWPTSTEAPRTSGNKIGLEPARSLCSSQSTCIEEKSALHRTAPRARERFAPAQPAKVSTAKVAPARTETRSRAEAE